VSLRELRAFVVHFIPRCEAPFYDNVVVHLGPLLEIERTQIFAGEFAEFVKNSVDVSHKLPFSVRDPPVHDRVSLDLRQWQ